MVRILLSGYFFDERDKVIAGVSILILLEEEFAKNRSVVSENV